jgi:prepilin-type N-terminal cleavage/methylation domain-containing protein
MCKKSGFTLVEMLVVIAIIGVLVALMLPAVQSARESARRAKCANNLKQLALALHQYEGIARRLPWGNAYGSGKPRVTINWIAAILPQMEMKNHYQLFDFSQDMNAAANDDAMTINVPALICPTGAPSTNGILPARCTCCNLGSRYRAMATWYTASLGPSPTGSTCWACPDPKPDRTNYCCQGGAYGQSATGPGMFMRWQFGIPLAAVTDGLSNTWMLGEDLPETNFHNTAFGANLSCNATSVPLNLMLPKNQWPQDGMSDSTLHSTNPSTAPASKAATSPALSSLWAMPACGSFMRESTTSSTTSSAREQALSRCKCRTDAKAACYSQSLRWWGVSSDGERQTTPFLQHASGCLDRICDERKFRRHKPCPDARKLTH